MKKFLLENRLLLLFLLGMVCFRTAVADWSPVPSGSMEPTIQPRDVLLVDKTVLGPSIPFTEVRLWQKSQPQRGDIVTLRRPDEDLTLVKRVVGLPGDRIRMQGIQLFINDVAVPLQVTDTGEHTGIVRAIEQLGEHRHGIQLDRRLELTEIRDEIVVPADSYFVMGDFRNNSIDSRWFGAVHRDKVIGKVERLLLSAAENREWLTAPLQKLE